MQVHVADVCLLASQRESLMNRYRAQMTRDVHALRLVDDAEKGTWLIAACCEPHPERLKRTVEYVGGALFVTLPDESQLDVVTIV
jgi:hypothetical protein